MISLEVLWIPCNTGAMVFQTSSRKFSPTTLVGRLKGESTTENAFLALLQDSRTWQIQDLMSQSHSNADCVEPSPLGVQAIHPKAGVSSET